MVVDGTQVAYIERGGIATKSALFQPLFISQHHRSIHILQRHIISFQVIPQTVDGCGEPVCHAPLAEFTQLVVQLHRVTDDAM